MRSSNSKNYSVEFKQSSAKLAVESNQSIAQTARELGVNVNTLHGWVSKYADQPQSTVSSKDSEHEELKRLRKELARVKQERDILKKATAYFANETQ